MFRRWMLALAALLLFGAASAEGPVCVVSGELACLVDESGGTLLAGTEIEDMFVVRENALYAAGRRGEYRLYDAAGRRLGDAAFAMIDDAGDCLVFRKGNRYGAMNAAGDVLLAAEWTQLISDGAGGFLALRTDPLDESPDAILRVGADGEAHPTGVYTIMGLEKPRDGRVRVMAANGRMGAIDLRGAWAVPTVWRALGAFSGGCAKAVGEDGMGLIDTDGVPVIPATYDWLERGDGIVAALRADGADVYSADGAALRFSIGGVGLEASVAGNRLLLRDGASARLFDANGDLLGTFGAHFNAAPGLDGQLIAWEGAWGEKRAWLMNPDGSAASDRFQNILPLAAKRYAFTEMQGIEYYSEDLGRIQTSWNYASLRVGLMDAGGSVLLPAAYREIRAVGDDRLLLVSDGGVALADMDGVAIREWLTAEGAASTAAGGS